MTKKHLLPTTKERWIVRIKSTKEEVARFRLRITATMNLPKLKDMYHAEELEVIWE